jgi:alkaline phosphatase D
MWSRQNGTRTAPLLDRRAPEDDGTMAFSVPDDVPAIGPLAPATKHGFRITVSETGELVGEGCFETAPAEGTRGGSFAFAFMSCHQPFRHDGSVHPDSARMLAALEPALEARGVKYVLMIGDQIYADAPQGRRLLRADSERPLLGMSVEAIRTRYQARYRLFWAFPEIRRLQARWPTWCMWDDHEIADDWGARRVHRRPAWQRVFEGARRAFMDYQAARTMVPPTSSSPPPSSLHQSFAWGATATFLMDLCSQRTFEGRRRARVYGDDQLAALRAFLNEHRSCPVVFVVLTVPLIYLPDWVVRLGERVPDRARFLPRAGMQPEIVMPLTGCSTCCEFINAPLIRAKNSCSCPATYTRERPLRCAGLMGAHVPVCVQPGHQRGT